MRNNDPCQSHLIMQAKLGSIWESLIQPKPTHTCTCNYIQLWCAYEQMEYVLHFLVGLNEAYSSIRGQILSMDPFPFITKTFSLVIQEENQKDIRSQPKVNLPMLSQSRMVFIL